MRVQHRDGTRALAADGRVRRAVDADVARRDVDVLPCEAPVPAVLDGRQTRRELQVGSGELLAAGREADVSAVEGQVADGPAAAVLHGDADGRGRILFVRHGHLKVAVADARSLADLPVDARRHVRLAALEVLGRHARHVEDEVADLAKEVALVDVPLRTGPARYVHVVIDEGYTREVGRPLDGRLLGGVADELSIVILDNGTRD